jgi:Second Messenger Oligonucleotide or Dinucleotide Synthetase domain
MGGSGGGGPFVYRSPQELAKLVRKAEDETSVVAFETKLSAMLNELLAALNNRDPQLVGERLDGIKLALENEIEGTIDQKFGGSVAKHTYVDGMSDIDSIAIINDTKLHEISPRQTLRLITKILGERLAGRAVVSHGRMAVTVGYQDGMKIQILPAIRMKTGRLRVPSSRSDDWSHINPTTFQAALTKRNEECGGKLVPMIKLAKAINGTLAESQRLSGYHMESLAIAAFRGYEGQKTTSAMLPRFFEKAKDLVLTPIRDSTGQSVHVDDYLGPANGDARVNASHILGRLAKRMWNATSSKSTGQWRALFGFDE